MARCIYIRSRRAGGPAGARAPRTASWRVRRGGQVLIVVLLGMTALAGLAFYVYNAGVQVNSRVEVQDVADAVAISGAAWMARSMNSIAMNNCAQARMLALVPTFDALNLASEMSFKELDEWIGDNAYSPGSNRPVRGLAAIAQGLGSPVAAIDRESGDKIRRGVESLLKRLREQRDILAAICDIKDDITASTNWAIRGVGGPPPHGHFWRAAAAMEGYSSAIANSAGVLAQANAVRFGQANNVDAAFVVPIAPVLPARRGQFDDFANVLRNNLRVNLADGNVQEETPGATGGAVPGVKWPHALGPWSRFFERPPWIPYSGHRVGRRGWRFEWGRWVDLGTTTTVVVPARGGLQISGPSAGGGLAGSPAPRGSAPRAGGTFTRRNRRLEVLGYTTFGPYYWAKQAVVRFAKYPYHFLGGHLTDTPFADYYTKIADAKLRYMFSGVNPPLEKIHYPTWKTDLAEARAIGEDPAKQVTKTRYNYVEAIYRIDGTSRTIISDNLSNPVTREFNKWMAPENLRSAAFSSNPRVSQPTQVGTLPIWKFTAEGVQRRYSPDGEMIEEWPIEFEWYFIFGGIDVGTDVDISNPCNWDALDQLPRPWVLDDRAVQAYTPDPDFVDERREESREQFSPRRERFAFLGVARKKTSAPFWPAKFSSGNPLESTVAVSQAKLLNNQSWDLWTQDWQAQLTSVRGWSQWVDWLDAGIDDVRFTNGMVDAGELERIRDYVWNITEDTVRDYLTH